jgi:hypothetical protein
MWRLMKSRVDSERLLLKRCSEKDDEARGKFLGHSYVNEVFRTVRLELQNDYDEAKVDDIATVILERIYELWEELPSPVWDLRTRIRRAAKKLAVDWRNRELAS